MKWMIDSQEKLLGLGLVYDSNNMHKTEILKQITEKRLVWDALLVWYGEHADL